MSTETPSPSTEAPAVPVGDSTQLPPIKYGKLTIRKHILPNTEAN